MASSIGAEKAALRTRVRALAAALPPAERRESDRALLRHFLALPEVLSAQTLLLFWGVGSEPDTRPLLEALQRSGRRVLLPRCLPHRAMEARLVRSGAELKPGAYGIPEPADTCPLVEKGDIDLMLVPALCYDRSGCRLGQGGGYYDRYLIGFGGRAVGLCRRRLLQERLPTQPHDRRVDLVVTEDGPLGPVRVDADMGAEPVGPAPEGLRRV